MIHTTHNRGYSLVEVLIAISILMITIVGPLTIAQKGLKNAIFAKDQTTAFYLAQEGMEVFFKAREDSTLAYLEGRVNDSWYVMAGIDQIDGNESCTEDDPCGIDFEDEAAFGEVLPFRCADRTCDIYMSDGDRTRYNHNDSGTLTPFRRELIIDADDERVHVRVIVSWGAPSETDKRVELESYIYNIYSVL